MSEKVLHEIKIIETEDGFRIEMTGDKEELRKLLFEQGKPFFMRGRGEPRHGFGGWGRGEQGRGGRGRGFGGHGPFGHHHEHGEHEHGMHEHGPFGRHEHGQHEHGMHGHDLREHMHPPFEGRERPTPEEAQNLHYFFRRFGGGRGGWKAKRGGYDLGPWWDESGTPSDDAPTQV